MSFQCSQSSRNPSSSPNPQRIELFVLPQQGNQLLNLRSRKVLLLDEEVCYRTTEEVVLHILEKTATVFGVLHERVEPVLLANGLTGYILLLLQYAQEGQYGIIGRLGVGELLQDFTDRGLLQVPQDVHYLQLSPSKFIASFHYS